MIPEFAENGLFLLNAYDPFTVANNIIEAPDGTIIITGSAVGLNESDVILVKLYADGKRFPGFGDEGLVFFDQNNDFGLVSVIQDDDKILTLGNFHPQTILLIRYNNELVSSNSVTQTALEQAQLFPNPAKSNTITLDYELSASSEITIELYQLNGQKVNTLLSESRPTGKNFETLRLPNNLATGKYFVKIQNQFGVSVLPLIYSR